MEALTELCDLVAKNPALFADKLSWICSRCPPPSSSAPHRLTRSHLNSLLALARFLSRSPHSSPSSRLPLLDFLRSAPLRPSLWPQSFPLDSICSFFSGLFAYLSIACSISPDLVSELQSFFGHTLASAAAQYSSSDDAAAVAKVFLNAVAHNCPPLLPADAERLVECLLDGVGEAGAATSSENSSSWDSKGKGKEEESREVMDDGSSENVTRENGSGTPRRSSADQMENGSSTKSSQSQSQQQGGAGRFEEEAVEVLEKMEIAFRLVGDVLDRGGRDAKLGNLEKVRKVATSQLKSLPAFLKVNCFIALA